MSKLDPSKTLAEQADPAYAKEKAEQDPDVAGHTAAIKENLTQDNSATISRADVQAAVTANQADQTDPPADGNANTDDEVDGAGVPVGLAAVVNEINDEDDGDADPAPEDEKDEG